MLGVGIPILIIFCRCRIVHITPLPAHFGKSLHKLQLTDHTLIIIMRDIQNIIIALTFFKVIDHSRALEVQLEAILSVVDISLQAVEALVVGVAGEGVRDCYGFVLAVFGQLEHDVGSYAGY